LWTQFGYADFEGLHEDGSEAASGAETDKDKLVRRKPPRISKAGSKRKSISKKLSDDSEEDDRGPTPKKPKVARRKKPKKPKKPLESDPETTEDDTDVDPSFA
jgi:hypothetical protein